jgi:hypothetical protein
MFTRRSLLLALPAVLLLAGVAAAAAWLARPKKTALTLEVSGTPGLAVKGTCEVDGSPRDLTGAVPTRFALEGYRVTYSLASTEDSGEFRVKAATGDIVLDASGSGNPPKNGVRGWVKSRWGGPPPSHWIESFDRDGQQGWLRPPP